MIRAGVLAALKDVYDKGKPEDIYSMNSFLTAKLNKKALLLGKNAVTPVEISSGTSPSSDYGRSLANSTTTQNRAWLLKRATLTNVAKVEYEEVVASEEAVGAFIETSIQNITSARKALLERGEFYLVQGDGSGTIDQLDAAVVLASPTIKLAKPELTKIFHVGDVLQLAASKVAAAPRTGRLIVIGVDTDAGTITVDANISSISGAAVTDFVCFDGDFKNGLYGFNACVPAVAPTSGQVFQGIDRSEDVARLAGHRINVSGLLTDAIGKADGRITTYQGKADTLLLSENKYSMALTELDGKVRYYKQDIGKISFHGLEFNSRSGSVIHIFQHFACDDKTGYLFDSSACQIWHAKGLAHTVDFDSLDWRQVPGTLSFAISFVTYMQFLIKNPGVAARLIFP